MIILFFLLIFLFCGLIAFGEWCYERDWPRDTGKFALIAGLLFLCSISAFGQNNVRWDFPVYTVQAQGGNLLPVYAIPGAGITYYSCSGSTCTTLATTYISATSGTTCPTTPTPMQVVLNGTSACVATADPYGNSGGWFQPGQYMVTIAAQGSSYNYYFTVGAGQGSGCGSTPYPIPCGGTNATTAAGAATNLEAPAFCYVASPPTRAGIVACANSLAANYGGTVRIPAGTVDVCLPSDPNAGMIQMQPYTIYWGTAPSMTVNSSSAIDGAFVSKNSTNFICSTGAVQYAFTDGATPVVQYGTTGGMNNVSFKNLATNGIGLYEAGAQGVNGLVWGSDEDIWIRNPAEWGIKTWNPFHHDTNRVFVASNTNPNSTYVGCYRMGGNGAGALGGNLTWNHSICSNGTEKRGLVVGSVSGAGLNEIHFTRPQVNQFGGGLLTDTATITASSNNITLTNAPQFYVGEPFNFTSSLGNLTGGTAAPEYVFQSISGNTVTIGAGMSQSVITPSMSGTLTINTLGPPNIEFVSYGNQTVGGTPYSPYVANIVMDQMDEEGTAQNAFYGDNFSGYNISFSETNQNYALFNARSSGYGTAHALPGAGGYHRYDYDGSAGSAFELYGGWDTGINQSYVGITANNGSGDASNISLTASNPNGDLEAKDLSGSWHLFPNVFMEHLVTQLYSGGQLSTSGDVVVLYQNSSTNPLPTVSATNLGQCYELNNPTATVETINTSSSQTFNNLAGSTSVSLPAGATLRACAAEENTTFYWMAYLSGIGQYAPANILNTLSNLQIGQVAVGGLQNYIQNAATMTGTGWNAVSATVTGGQADPFGGTNAISFATASTSGAYVNHPTSQDLVSGHPYTACGWLKGVVGGEQEQVFIGGYGSGSVETFTIGTGWNLPSNLYCFTTTPTTNLANTFVLASLTNTSQTVYAYGWNVVPGSSQQPFLRTYATPVTSVTQEVDTPLVNASSVNINGNTVLPSTLTGDATVNSGTKVVIAPTIPGAGAAVMTGPATSTSGDCVKFADGVGTLADAGSACGSGSGATQSGVQQQAYSYAADTGTANAYAVTLSPTPTLVAGSDVVFKAANANTGSSTLAVNSGSPVTIYKKGGTTALTGAEIAAGQVVRVVYDGTYFQMQSQSATTVSAPSAGLTTNYYPIASSGNVLGNGTIDHGVTIAGTDTDSQNLAATGLTENSVANVGTPSGTPSTTGGTVAASTTNFAYIDCYDSSGTNTTLPTNKSSNVTTTGTTSSIAWTWTAVTGCVTYRVWVATSGTPSRYFTSAANSYTQTLPASSGTSGTFPTQNTTGVASVSYLYICPTGASPCENYSGSGAQALRFYSYGAYWTAWDYNIGSGWVQGGEFGASNLYVNNNIFANLSIAAPLLTLTSNQSTVSCSTSGSAVFSEPFNGSSDRRVLIHLSACLGTASYTYPAAFTNTPSIYASNNVAAAILTSVSTTAVTVTGSTTTGSIFLEDY